MHYCFDDIYMCMYISTIHQNSIEIYVQVLGSTHVRIAYGATATLTYGACSRRGGRAHACLV